MADQFPQNDDVLTINISIFAYVTDGESRYYSIWEGASSIFG